MQQENDKRGRSRWSSSEGERWWLGAATYVAGGVATLLGAALIAVVLIEEIWVLVIGVAIIGGITAVIWYLWNEYVG